MLYFPPFSVHLSTSFICFLCINAGLFARL
nr:MAG TPA: hypothetical protein [Caudoviricetes sp.]